MAANLAQQAVGTVTIAIGEVKVTGTDGAVRTVQVGDKVFANDSVSTGALAAVQIRFDNGTTMELGRDSQMALTEEVYGGPPAQVEEDVAATQAAILAGEDPTEVAEAPAAGGPQSGGGHSFVVVDQANATGEVTAGFVTNPIAIGFPSPDPEAAPVVPEPAVNTPPVVGVDLARLSEEGLPGGLPEGPGGGDETTATTVSGTIAMSDADGDALAVTLGAPSSELSSGGVPIVWSGDGTQQLVGTAGGVVVVTVVIDNSGAYSVTLAGPVDHPDPGAEDLRSFDVPVHVSDGGASARGTLTVIVGDDGPRAADDAAGAAEDTAVTVDVLANDEAGADGGKTLVSATLATEGAGSLAYDVATGRVTFTPAAGFEGEVRIDYTMRDADGDLSSAALTVTIGADSKPTVSAVGAEVDETGGLDSVVGTLTASFGADLPGTVALSAAGASWDAATATLAAADGSWRAVVNGDGTYTFTQLAAMNHPDASDPDDAIPIVITATATDAEGDVASTSFTVTVRDDGPRAADDAAGAAEDTAVTVDVLANDEAGADGGKTLVSATLATEGAGSLAYDVATGRVTFTPAAGFEGEARIDYTMRDADGDLSSAALTVTIGADSKPTMSAVGAEVDETGGLDSVVGTLTASFGADLPDTVALSAAGASWDAATATLAAADGSWRAVVNGDGTYTFTQLAAMNHPDASDPDDAIPIVITATATDAEGDVASTSFTVTVRDDGPILGDVMDAIVANETGAVVGSIDIDYGTDGSAATALRISAWNDLPGVTETLSPDGLVLTATVDATGETFYTLTLDPATGLYTFEHAERPSLFTALDFSRASGGPGNETLQVPAGDAYTVQFDGKLYQDGALVDAGANESERADDIKPTGTGFGVGGADDQTTIENDEGFVVSFRQEGTGAAFDDPVDAFAFSVQRNGGGPDSAVTVNWIAYDAGGNPVGAGDEDVLLGQNNTNYPLTIEADDGFASLHVWFSNIDAGDGNIRIEQFFIGNAVIPQDEPLQFGVVAMDGDGDISAQANLSILLSGGAGPAFTLSGTSENEVLVGGAGNDILVGGDGEDILYGGDGSDTFTVTADLAPDVIKDFSAGAGGDVLDLRAVLGGTGSEELADYLRVEQVGSDTVISIDTSGSGAPGVPVVTLEGVTGVTLEQLVANNQIVT